MTTGHWLVAAALGVCVSGGAYLLQAFGQAVVPVATAGLLLMTEPVIAVLVGWLAGERLTAHQVTGIGLLALAILFAIGVMALAGSAQRCLSKLLSSGRGEAARVGGAGQALGPLTRRGCWSSVDHVPPDITR
jgi:hypothetical protein